MCVFIIKKYEAINGVVAFYSKHGFISAWSHGMWGFNTLFYNSTITDWEFTIHNENCQDIFFFLVGDCDSSQSKENRVW